MQITWLVPTVAPPQVNPSRQQGPPGPQAEGRLPPQAAVTGARPQTPGDRQEVCEGQHDPPQAVPLAQKIPVGACSPQTPEVQGTPEGQQVAPQSASPCRQTGAAGGASQGLVVPQVWSQQPPRQAAVPGGQQ